MTQSGTRFLILCLTLVWVACNTQPPSSGNEPPIVTSVAAEPAEVPTPTLAAVREPDVNVTQGAAFIPELGNSGYDVLHYNLQLNLDPNKVHVEGVTTISMQILEDGLSAIPLDFIGYSIESLTFNGIDASFERNANKLIVKSPLALEAGWLVELKIAYSGEPVMTKSPYNHLISHVGLHFPMDGSLFAVAQPDGARYWYPSNDHPRDKALFRFEITVPKGLTAIANGLLRVQQETDAGDVFVWEHSVPMATYLATVAVDDYVLMEETTPRGVRVRHYVSPEMVDQFSVSAEIVDESLDWMSDLFGPYPFEAFGFATVNLLNLSLETQSLSLISDYAVDDRTIIHEMAHMWFGDWVGLSDWDEMWRNEGFATYLELMWLADGDADTLQLLINSMANDSAVLERGYELGNVPPEWLFGYENYYKGALFVHELRQTMGDEAFFKGLQQYFVLYGGDVASDAQFLATMEDAAGIDLAPLWNNWFVRAP